MRLQSLQRKLEILAGELEALNMELGSKNPETSAVRFIVRLDLQEAEEATSRAAKFVKEYLGDMDS